MRLLAIHSVGDETDGRTSPPVHVWRIWRPIRELKKHVDWEIDEQHHLIEHIADDDSPDYTPVEIEVAAKNLGTYDVVFLSYSILNAQAYALMLAVTARHGTQFVIDCDDNVFSINEHNPIWLTVSHDRMYDLQTILRDAAWVTTTTERLASVLRERRPQYARQTVGVLPNYITDDYKHPPIKHDDKIVIGYFGGSSHFADLNDTGFRKAMRDIMRKHKNVHFRTVGIPLDIPMPRSRESFVDAVRGLKFISDVYPTLDMDIAVAPLEANVFNDGKSNIKWQEATRAGAAFVCSALGPYADLPASVAVKVGDSRAQWFAALESVVVDRQSRLRLMRNAQHELAENWRLEDHWPVYRDYFEAVVGSLAGNVQ